VNDDEPRDPWDRRPTESPLAYSHFRRFRDLGPLRSLDMLVDERTGLATFKKWQARHDWRDRASAWDEAAHRIDDARRLEALRGMHDLHQRAGRAVLNKALQALANVAPEDIPPYAAARMLELGARLERDTLVTSVEELQGVPPAQLEDPWEAVARELEGLPGA
jgi:hypothetical protein